MRCIVRFLVVLLMGSIPLLSQMENASISGRVTDPSGAAVIGAGVQITNVDTGVTISINTNGAGFYVATGLLPGKYRVTVSKEGFQTINLTGVELNVQDYLSKNFELKVGSVSEQVTVVANALNINTTGGSVSTVVDQSYIQNMPLNGHSFQDLILLTPGTVTQTPQSPGTLGATGEFSVNGQRTEENYYTVDGVSGNIGAAVGTLNGYDNTAGSGPSGSVPGATALGTTQALVSVDALQEFRVQSSSYSAEYGRNPGGQFAFETKSGNNQWHGSAFDYLRNGFFDAQDWFNDYAGLTNSALHQNDFGGTLGGPVIKDKTFFFASYEGLRLNAPVPANPALYVPDNALRASAPAVLQPVMNAYPEPSPNGQDFPSSGAAQYLATWANPSSLNTTGIRFDQNVSGKLRLFFRFNNSTSDSSTRGNSSGDSSSVETISSFTTRTYTAGATSLFSARLSNDFRVNYSSNVSQANEFISPIGGSSGFDLNQASGLGPNGGGTFCILQFISGQCMGLDQARWSGAQHQWNIVDTVSLSLGRHQLKFGADYRRLTPDAIVGTPDISYGYYSLSDVQSNNATLFLGQENSAYPLYRNFSAFVDDQWRVLPRLTLDAGLRWDVNPPPGVTQGLMPFTIQGSNYNTAVVQPQGTPLWKTTWWNFAPRLGVAYTMHDRGGWQSTLRGGAGVFFDTGNQMGSLGFVGPGFHSLTITPGSYPVSASTPGIIPPVQNPCQQSGCLGPYDGTPYGYAPHLQLPYSLHWNASFEQALGKSQALTVSYVASHGSRLLQTNYISPQNNPNAGFFVLVSNGLTSDYHSLQTQFQRRLSKGLTVLASYTWSHCIDYGSDNGLLGAVRGNCDFDVRHNVSAAFSYDVADVGQNGFARAVLHGWGLDSRFTARTSFPIQLYGYGFYGPDGKYHSESLSFAPGVATGQVPIYLYGANCASVLQAAGELDAPRGQTCPGGKAINPNAFVDVGGLGDEPRNFARLFGAWEMDTAVRREFPITESVKLQFRAEAFNIFNHPNFGTVDDQYGDPKFGLATGTLAQALSTESPLYQLGGPRSMQFALKLVF